MEAKLKRVWTEKTYRLAFKDLGAKAPKVGTTNPEYHKALVALLKERDPEASVEERMDTIYDNVSDGGAPDTKDAKGPEPKHANSCDSYGAGYQKNAKECKACPDKTTPANVERCKELSVVAASKKKAKAEPKAPSQNIRPKYDNFEALKAHLSQIEPQNITMVVNKNLIYGYKWTTILKRVDDARDALRAANKKADDFKDVSRLKAHVRFMEKQKGWVFKRDGEKIQLIGYKPPKVETPATQKKAA